MSCTIQTVAKSPYLHVVLTGTWSTSDNDRLIGEVSAGLAQDHNRLVLLDVRSLRMNSSTIQDYTETLAYVNAFIGNPHKMAVLCGPNEMRDLSFREVVACNRGLPVHLFNSEQVAVQWLIGKGCACKRDTEGPLPTSRSE